MLIIKLEQSNVDRLYGISMRGRKIEIAEIVLKDFLKKLKGDWGLINIKFINFKGLDAIMRLSLYVF